MEHESTSHASQFYARQSWVTDPGSYSYLLEQLPADTPALCEVVRGLVFHYCEGEMYGVEIPDSRRAELDIRSVAPMLERIVELHSRPLDVARQPELRLIGCCRDFSVLLCAMLRHHGVPSRVRFGFSAYFRPDFLCDHVVVEYWNREERRWVLVDAQMDDRHCAMNHLDFDPHDVPRDRFLPAGDVWQRCRRGELDPDRCGVDEDIAGLWFVGRYVVHDLAALNSMEVLCWDAWGYGENRPGRAWSQDALEALDRAAALTLAGDEAFPGLRRTYQQDPGFRIPRRIRSYSPAGHYTTALPFR